uniref:Uncharacterized protein n=1 Tax=Ackermannviridae sp. TaxID=2831612 RepID=A0A8S5VKW9_9CAUD|nr:MAG TPA: hypothetical protein [Ackermannviridae sp.]
MDLIRSYLLTIYEQRIHRYAEVVRNLNQLRDAGTVYAAFPLPD